MQLYIMIVLAIINNDKKEYNKIIIRRIIKDDVTINRNDK